MQGNPSKVIVIALYCKHMEYMQAVKCMSSIFLQFSCLLDQSVMCVIQDHLLSIKRRIHHIIIENGRC